MNIFTTVLLLWVAADASRMNSQRGVAVSKPTAFNVTFLTWNLAMDCADKKDCAFLSKECEDSALLVIGLQEVEDLKPRRSEGHRSRLIRKQILKAVGKTHAPVSLQTHGSTQLLVYVKKDCASLLSSELPTWEVTCGVGNLIQNKGALGLFCQLGGRRLCFISGHLAAHQTKVASRNEDYRRILRETEAFLSRSYGEEREAAEAAEEGEEERANLATPMLDSMDGVFFGGDLNYRLDLTREEVSLIMLHVFIAPLMIDARLSSKVDLCLGDGADGLDALLERDQLTRVRFSGEAFSGFTEGPVTFPPTFKFDDRADTYDTSTKRRVRSLKPSVFALLQLFILGNRCPRGLTGCFTAAERLL